MSRLALLFLLVAGFAVGESVVLSLTAFDVTFDAPHLTVTVKSGDESYNFWFEAIDVWRHNEGWHGVDIDALTTQTFGDFVTFSHESTQFYAECVIDDSNTSVAVQCISYDALRVSWLIFSDHRAIIEFEDGAVRMHRDSVADYADLMSLAPFPALNYSYVDRHRLQLQSTGVPESPSSFDIVAYTSSTREVQTLTFFYALIAISAILISSAIFAVIYNHRKLPFVATERLEGTQEDGIEL